MNEDIKKNNPGQNTPMDPKRTQQDTPGKQGQGNQQPQQPGRQGGFEKQGGVGGQQGQKGGQRYDKE